MANELSIFLLLIATIMFILQPVRLRYLYTTESILDFELIFFHVVLYPSRTPDKKKRQKRKLTALQKKIINTRSLKRALEYVLKFSDVTLYNIDVVTYQKTPYSASVSSQGISSFIYYLLAYVNCRAKSFRTEDFNFTIPYSHPHNTRVLCDLTLEFKFFHIYGFLYVYFSNYLRMKGRAKQRYVRK